MLVRSWRKGQGTPNWVLYRAYYFKRGGKKAFSTLWQEVSVLSVLFVLLTRKRQCSLVYIFKMESFDNRRNCLFSLSWQLDKRKSGKFVPPLRDSEQRHPGVGGLQASTLCGRENCGLLTRAGRRHRDRLSKWWKERNSSWEPREVCARAAVSQEADFPHENGVLWANWGKWSPCTTSRENSCQIPLFLFKLTWRSYFFTLQKDPYFRFS